MSEKTPKQMIEEAAWDCVENRPPLLLVDLFTAGALFGARLGFEAGQRAEYNFQHHNGKPPSVDDFLETLK